jgi:hypothetical protein
MLSWHVILQGETGLSIRTGNAPNYIANYMNLGLTEYRLLIMPKAGNDIRPYLREKRT